MAAQLQLARETHVYISDGTVYWRVPVLNGFSFSQATSSTEVATNEMADSTGASRRGRQMFNDAFDPAEWSFSVYSRPWQTAGTGGFSVEEALWANFIADNTYTHGTTSWSAGVTRDDTAHTVVYDFDDSNVAALGTFDIYFILGGCSAGTTAYDSANGQAIYKISDAVVNSATMNFEIDGIANIEWSGFGASITELSALDLSSATIIDGGVDSTDNFIRNRLTTLSVTTTNQNQDGAAGDEFLATYNLALTNGSISFENNITFLTPEEICKVNQPIGHVTGTRNISGNFTCYLNTGTNAGGEGTSADLFDDLATATGLQTNEFVLEFSIGGGSSPKIVFNIPQAHLEIPTHSIDDIISLDTTFHALPSGMDNTDEATITYHSA